MDDRNITPVNEDGESIDEPIKLLNTTVRPEGTVESESVRTNHLYSESLSASVRVWRDNDGIYHADGSNGEISNGSDCGKVLSEVIDKIRTPRSFPDYEADYIGKIHLSNGIFELHSSIYLPGGTRGFVLEGEGDSTILQVNKSGIDAIRINTKDEGYNTWHAIRSLTIDGNERPDESKFGSVGIDGYVNNIMLRDMTVKNFNTTGVRFQKDDNREYSQGENFIRSLIVDDCGTGIEIATNDCEILGSIVRGCPNRGLYLRDWGGTNVSATHIWGNGEGIKVENHSTARFVNVEVEGNTSHGISFEGEADSIENSKLIASDVWENGKPGSKIHQLRTIGKEGVNGLIVMGCEFSSEEKRKAPAISEEASTTRGIYLGNTFSGFETNIDQKGESLVNFMAEEKAQAEKPQQDWPVGTTVKFTDTGDGSGTGVFEKLIDGSWHKK